MKRKRNPVGDVEKPARKRRRKNINFLEKIIELMKLKGCFVKQSEIVKYLEEKYSSEMDVKCVSSCVNANLRKWSTLENDDNNLFCRPERGIYGLKVLETQYIPYVKKNKQKNTRKKTKVLELGDSVSKNRKRKKKKTPATSDLNVVISSRYSCSQIHGVNSSDDSDDDDELILPDRSLLRVEFSRGNRQ